MSSNKINQIPTELIKSLKFNNSLEELKEKIDEEIDILRRFKNEIKKIEVNYQQDITKIWKSKKKRAPNNDKTGFIKKKKLPEKLAKLIQVPTNTEMSMPEYTKQFYEKVLEKDKLFYEKDRRVFRANKKLLKIFELPESVNKSVDYKDKSGFNFSTLQKHFSRIMKENEENNSESDTVSQQNIKKKKAKIIKPQKNELVLEK